MSFLTVRIIQHQRRQNGKGKVHHRTDHEGPEGEVGLWLYPFFNFGARCGVGGQLHASVGLPPGKETRYPLYSGRVGPRAGL